MGTVVAWCRQGLSPLGLVPRSGIALQVTFAVSTAIAIAAMAVLLRANYRRTPQGGVRAGSVLVLAPIPVPGNKPTARREVIQDMRGMSHGNGQRYRLAFALPTYRTDDGAAKAAR